MMKRRQMLKIGLSGSAAALLPGLGSSNLASARDGDDSDPVVSPPTTPFMDKLPLPPSPREVEPARNQPLPTGFEDLDAEARQYVDFSGTKGKARFFKVVAEVRKVKFHSQLPPTEIWGYRDGNLEQGETWNFALGPTFRTSMSDNPFLSTIVRHSSDLPGLKSHIGFGVPRSTVHLHGGHHAPRFDGFPTDVALPDGTRFNVTFVRGGHFDYAYPLVDPGFFQNASTPGERPSTLWYHDHLLDFTAQNVYRGLAGLFLVYEDPRGKSAAFRESALDTGDETNAENVPNALRLPSGAFDIPLVLQEKTFRANGELFYDVFNTGGFMGDKYLVNGMIQPYLNVKRRKYRFRFLNGSNSRFYHLSLTDKNGRSYPMTQIATEGGLLSRPIQRSGFLLGMAERVEVIIDFNNFPEGQFTELFIENRLIQEDGRGPKGKLDRPELAARGTRIMKFVLEERVADPSNVPSVLRPFAPVTQSELARAPVRTFVFERENGQWVINEKPAGDLTQVMATPAVAEGEIWRLINKSGGWWHPIHIHDEFARVIRRNGRPPFDGTGPDFGQPVERDGIAKKDTIVLGPNDEVDVFVKFRDFRGPYVFHCHNLEHEDHAMMARYDVV